MSTKTPSLAEFAQAKAKPPCRVCILPEVEEINSAYKEGTSRRLIIQWLNEVKLYKPPITAGAVDKHFVERHHDGSYRKLA